jgi:hypothetical protein
MMAGLPSQVNFGTAAGSQWAQTFQFTGVDITGLSWEFVIRPHATDTTVPPLVKVTTTASAQGQIVVNTVAGTVQVVLTPAATTLLKKGARPYALWSNPATTSATTWCEGMFNSRLVPAP